MICRHLEKEGTARGLLLVHLKCLKIKRKGKKDSSPCPWTISIKIATFTIRESWVQKPRDPPPPGPGPLNACVLVCVCMHAWQDRRVNAWGVAGAKPGLVLPASHANRVVRNEIGVQIDARLLRLRLRLRLRGGLQAASPDEGSRCIAPSCSPSWT